MYHFMFLRYFVFKYLLLFLIFKNIFICSISEYSIFVSTCIRFHSVCLCIHVYLYFECDFIISKLIFARYWNLIRCKHFSFF